MQGGLGAREQVTASHEIPEPMLSWKQVHLFEISVAAAREDSLDRPRGSTANQSLPQYQNNDFSVRSDLAVRWTRPNGEQDGYLAEK